MDPTPFVLLISALSAAAIFYVWYVFFYDTYDSSPVSYEAGKWPKTKSIREMKEEEESECGCELDRDPCECDNPPNGPALDLGTNALDANLPDDFPHVEILRENGIRTYDDIAFTEDFTSIPKIGKKRAQNILEELVPEEFLDAAEETAEA